MPTTEDIDAARGEPEVVPEPEAPAGPQPTFSLEQVKEVVREAVSPFVKHDDPKPRQTYVEPTPDEPTDEEIANNPRLAMQKEVARQLHPIRQQMAFGLDRIADLTTGAEGTNLPYYKDYRGEIDGELSKLDPVLRTNKDTIRLVHDAVAMRHEGERLEKARDEGRRQTRGNAPLPTGARPDPNSPKVPTPEELFDPLLVEDINAKGGPDAFARRISDGRYKNWGDYVAAKERMESAPTKLGGRGPARVISFARLEPKRGAKPAA